jgi:hypothetical protein
MRQNTKINRHEKIAALLKTGQPVSPEKIREAFAGTEEEQVLYRLSTFIYNIKKDGGVIRCIKDKRRVSGYQLMNPHHFNDQGRYVGFKNDS